MLREPTDRMSLEDAARIWKEEANRSAHRRVAQIEAELSVEIDRDAVEPMGFYEAMRHFIALRDKVFPELSTEAAWNILVTLANTTNHDARNSITGIAYGAGVPLTTALRYIGIMEVEGIIERVPDPADGRRFIIQLTAEGRDRLDFVASKWKARGAMLMALVPIGLICTLFAVVAA